MNRIEQNKKSAIKTFDEKKKIDTNKQTNRIKSLQVIYFIHYIFIGKNEQK